MGSIPSARTVDDLAAHMTIYVGAWVVVAVLGVLALTQLFGWTGWAIVYVLQAFTPHAVLAAAIIGITAAATARQPLAVVSGLTTVILATVVWPAIAGADRPPIPDQAVVLRIAHANTYYANESSAAAAKALAKLDVDLLTITEYSPEVEAALDVHLGDGAYPYRVGDATEERNGIGLLSRRPIVSSTFALFRWQPGIEVVIDVDGTFVRVLVVHPVPATEHADVVRWRDDLDFIGDRATTPGPPTIVVGDFNAARWHPPFRRLLGRGLAEVHEMFGRGWTASWPADSLMPRFVRLDHALVDDRCVPTDLDEVSVPGSDHTGFVVTIAVAASATT